MYQTGYKAAFKAANITEADLLTKARATYQEVVKLETELNNLRGELQGATAQDRQTMQQEIDRAEKILQTLDTDLCKKIASNEKIKANVTKMQQSRAANKTPKAASGASTPAATPPADPNPPAPAAPPADPNPPAPNTPPADPKKKEGGGGVLGYVLMGLAMVVGGAAAVQYVKKGWPFNRR